MKARKPGRPPLLTAAVEKRLVKMLMAGSTINGACAVCGIASRTHTAMENDSSLRPMIC